MIYLADSFVCKSAIHSGFIEDEEGGEVIIMIANGENEYASVM